MKVSFQRRSNMLMPSRDGGWARQRTVALCDLARPVAELRILAIAMSADTAQWTREADVIDAVLTVAIDPDDAWGPQERALHQLLGIVRHHVDETLAFLRSTPPPITLEPTRHAERSTWYRGAHAGIKGTGAFSCGGEFRMPENHYRTGFGIDRTDNGILGYFVESRSGHDHTPRRIAAALLAAVLPEAGVGECAEASWGELPIAYEVDGLRNMAVACYNSGVNLIGRIKTAVSALEWQGAPSDFTSEDDDARDALLARIVAGERLTREKAPDDEDRPHNEGGWLWLDADGIPVDGGAVRRLLVAHLVMPEDGLYGSSAVLIAAADITARDLSPRAATVRFRAFESYCSHRRHDDGEDECAHRRNRGCSANCGPHSCPLVTQVYTDEHESYRSRIGDDPAFEGFDDLDRDPLVTADHRNTERSAAWRAAGEDGVIALVNQVLGAWNAYGVPLLVDLHLSAHAEKAVELGHLRVVERITAVCTDEAFGIVLQPSAELLDSMSAIQDIHRVHMQSQPVV